MVSDTSKHYPVLLNEIISIITPQHGGTFIDCTFGQGGYTKEILKFNKTRVIALDRDIKSKKKADEIEKRFSNRLLFKNKKFSQLDDLKLKDQKITSVIFDLGYSFAQIKDQEKGLSFNSDGELNMQMGLNDFSAKDVINKLDVKELEKIFKYFGEETDAKRIAKNIILHRKKKEIDTECLIKLIDSSKRRKNSKTHNATKIFQAIRIHVNDELKEIIKGLPIVIERMKPGSRMITLTYHSLEHTLVSRVLKQKLSAGNIAVELTPNLPQLRRIGRAYRATQCELQHNPRARSALLRVWEVGCV